MTTVQPNPRTHRGRAVKSTGPQMVTCEICERAFKSRRTDGRVARFCSRDCYNAWNRGPTHPAFRNSGDYWAIHGRVRRARGPAKLQKCIHCANRGTDKHARDWALRHGLDGKDPGDFMPLCRSCHIAYDKPKFGKPKPGDLNGSAKLTWEQVREIRALRGTAPAGVLASRYGVSRSAVSLVIRGVTWKESPTTG